MSGDALIDRLRAATGPDRELDREINLHVFSQHALPSPPMYTESIDAALTTVKPTDRMAVLREAIDDVSFAGWADDNLVFEIARSICIAALESLKRTGPNPVGEE